MSCDIIWYESLDSTNSELRRRISEFDNLSVIASRAQSAGRGQGTHSWHSTAGMNLTFSIVYKSYGLPVSEALLITCATTLGIRDYLLSKGVESRIKWPNDIWVGDRKICGILIENRLESTEILWSIVGIGLNLNETEWPKDLPNPVSLKDLTGINYDVDSELVSLHKKICCRCEQLRFADSRLLLQEEFEKYMFRLP